MARGHTRGRGFGRQHDSGAPILRVDPGYVSAVMKRGATVPHSTTLPPGGKIRVGNGSQTGASMADTSASVGGAAEFSVAPTGSTTPPYDLTLTWLGNGLSALSAGVYSRVLTVTAEGATGSPKSVPIRIEVI